MPKETNSTKYAAKLLKTYSIKNHNCVLICADTKYAFIFNYKLTLTYIILAIYHFLFLQVSN